jgi:hypothetical protein
MRIDRFAQALDCRSHAGKQEGIWVWWAVFAEEHLSRRLAFDAALREQSPNQSRIGGKICRNGIWCDAPLPLARRVRRSLTST